MPNILFIGKKGDHFSEFAARFTQEIFPDVIVVMSEKGSKIPDNLKLWKGDYLFSYLSQWIIPQHLLDAARIAALNWHPGPPEYPGIGCTNFAIYDMVDTFGITCHHMLAKVDTGKLVEVLKFPILKQETVYSLTQKCYSHILISYMQVLDRIAQGQPLPILTETWKRKPFTRKQLNNLCQLDKSMSDEEISRRIRATKYDRHWAYFMVDGQKKIVQDGEK